MQPAGKQMRNSLTNVVSRQWVCRSLALSSSRGGVFRSFPFRALDPFLVSLRCFASSPTTDDETSASYGTTDKTSRLLRVAILGPPNAGKSTLFNRLLDKHKNKTYRLRAARRNKRGRLSASLPATFVRGGALVSAIPGTTRDRRQAMGRLGSITFLLMDTAGVDGLRLKSWYRGRQRNPKKSINYDDNEDDEDDDYERPMMEQAVLAAQSASVIFFMFDGRIGLTADDLETCRWLRRHVLSNKKEQKENPQRVVMVANKLEGTVLDDNETYQDYLTEASRAGFGPAIPISALQGDGMADIAVVLLEMKETLGLTEDSDDESNEQDKNHPLQMAILGRPNVGKSTLVNALLQEQRVITGSRPGLTRDAIRVPWTWQNQPVQIVDTAGIRKASQRQDPQLTTSRKFSDPAVLEDMAVHDALRALQVADVAVLVIDADERSLLRQDLAIANAILDEGRVLVVVANKIDLVIDEDDTKDPFTRHDLAKAVREHLETRFPFLRMTPIVPLDSRSGKGVADALMPVVMKAKERWERTISTGALNRWLTEVVDGHAPPRINGRRTKLKYILQTKGRPPTFILYTNQDKLPDPYIRYVTRQFQESFDMYGMKVRLAIKKSTSSDGTNPYEHKKKKRGGFGLGGREARHKRGVKNLIAFGSRQPRRGKRKPKKY